MENRTQEEWDALMSRFPPGTPVAGTVAACHVFGAFVTLDDLPDVTALLEIIHFQQVESHGRPVRHPEDYPAVGSRVEARVLAWSLRPHDVRLTQLSHLDWSHRRWLAGQGDKDRRVVPEVGNRPDG